jgi:hypothetical protein
MHVTQRNFSFSKSILKWIPIFIYSVTGAQAHPEDVAKKLNNPVANMISFPIQNNVDYGIGPHNGSRYFINVQPVIPLRLSENMNLIARIIQPVVFQRDVTGEGNNEDGLGDMNASFFFAPAESKNGFTWGLGPAFIIPTASDDLLGAKKWAIGPTALALKQANGWTYGFLASQVWSYAGYDDRPDLNQLFFQPFLAFNWKSGGGVSANSEMTHNWETETTTTSLNFLASGVTKLGKQIISLAIGPRIPIGGPTETRPDMGLRAVLTFVFPK